MIIPIRCFSCNALIAHRWIAFENAVNSGEQIGEILDTLGFTRICCRRMFMGHVNTIDQQMKYEPQNEKIQKDANVEELFDNLEL